MGNKSSINKRKLNEEYSKIIHTYWLFCPRCFQISSVKPFILNDELYISLYCKCLYDERQFMPFEDLLKLVMSKKAIGNFCKKHKNSQGFLYCIFCEKWLCDNCFLSHRISYPNHLLNHIPVRLKEYCYKHEKDLAVAYCKSCEKNVCEICLRDKQKLRHDIKMFLDPQLKIKCDEQWNIFVEKQSSHAKKNYELQDDIIEEINNTEELTENEKKDLKEKINIAYDKNKKINSKLCEFCLFLFSNFDYAFRLANIANYNISTNILNLRFNNAFFTLKKESASIKSNTEKLIDYFNNVHLMTIKPLVLVKNNFSERQNVTNQIAKIVLLNDSTVATLISKGIVIVWNYMTYDELYRIKKVTLNEKINNNINIINTNENNNNINNINNIDNIQDNIHNFILADDDDENNIIQQQFDIFNQIQGNIGNNNNIINTNTEIKKVTKLKVYHVDKINFNPSLINEMSYSEIINQNEINRMNSNERFDEEEESEGLDLNFNFTSIAYIKKYKILALIIENDKDIYLFNIKKQEAVPEKLIAHKKEVLEIVTLKNDNLASYGNDLTLRIWNMKYFQNVTTINVEIKKYYIYFTQLYFGNIIFATGKSKIKMLKLPEYEFQPDIIVPSPPINFFQLPDKRLLIASEDYYIRIYDPPDYTKFTFLSKTRQKIYSFILLDMNRLLVGIEENGAHFLNILNWRIKGHRVTQDAVKVYSPIGSIVKTKNKRVITISWDNFIKVFLVGN